MNRLKVLKYLLVIGYIVYLIIDSIHFVSFRLTWIDGVEGFYPMGGVESFSLSAIHWSACLIGLIILFQNTLLDKIKTHFISSIASLTVLFLFFTDGQFLYLVKGSFVSNLFLLEITSLLAIVYWFYKIPLKTKTRLFHYALALLVGLFFSLVIESPLPIAR